MKKLFGIAFATTLLDQLIKNGLLFFMSYGESLTVINGFFNVTLIGNTGAAFSILSSNTLLLIIISLVVLNVLYFGFIKGKNLNDFEQLSFGLLIGGILGNLIDRVLHMQVIDYLDFTFFGFNFPVFNLADIAIVISMILIAIQVIKGDKNGVSSKSKWYKIR